MREFPNIEKGALQNCHCATHPYNSRVLIKIPFFFILLSPLSVSLRLAAPLRGAKSEIAARRASQEATESGSDCQSSCFLMPRGVVFVLPLCTRLFLRSEEAEEHGLEEPSLRKKLRNNTGPDLLCLRAERSANAIGALRIRRKPASATERPTGGTGGSCSPRAFRFLFTLKRNN